MPNQPRKSNGSEIILKSKVNILNIWCMLHSWKCATQTKNLQNFFCCALFISASSIIITFCFHIYLILCRKYFYAPLRRCITEFDQLFFLRSLKSQIMYTWMWCSIIFCHAVCAFFKVLCAQRVSHYCIGQGSMTG